jgi:radical SAM superfamily enzyme YgiQ (UPF0313 family)
VLLVSCYELGHAPHGVALPLAFLERAGFEPAAIDVAVEPLDAEKVARARFVGIAVPMHTALRLGVRVAERVRALNPAATICFYGLYAALNADYLLAHGADHCLGGEFEGALVQLLERLSAGQPALPTGDPGHRSGGGRRSVIGPPHRGPIPLERLAFPVPSRRALPALERYARLEVAGDERLVGYVEASRGCAHRCTHCPIPPVYGGRFFVVPADVVLEDARRQVAAGAQHLTFGDPDFLNGPGHALRIARALRTQLPGLTFDFTAKIEHLLERRALLPELVDCGALFVVSAVESLSEAVLRILDKGHTRADVAEALRLCRNSGLALRPTWVPFTPWSTRDDFAQIFEFVAEHDLVDHVDPVQYTIRLLVPPGSHLEAHPAFAPHRGPLDAAAFSYRWQHPDPEVDRLQEAATVLVAGAAATGEDAVVTFYRLWSLAAGRAVPAPPPPDRPRAPRLTEPWFC